MELQDHVSLVLERYFVPVLADAFVKKVKLSL
jgi:hypothetical protein